MFEANRLPDSGSQATSVPVARTQPVTRTGVPGAEPSTVRPRANSAVGPALEDVQTSFDPHRLAAPVRRARANSVANGPPPARIQAAAVRSRRLSIADATSMQAKLLEERGGRLLSPKQETLDTYELQIAREMHRCLSPQPGQPPPTAEQRKGFALILLKARGNPEVNRQMREILQHVRPPDQHAARTNGSPMLATIPADMAELLAEFSHRTKDLPEPAASVNRLQGLVDSFFTSGSVPNEKRLTLHEIGAIARFMKCVDACDLIRNLNLGEFDPSGDLNNIATANRNAGVVLGQINRCLDHETHYRSGDIFSTHPARTAALQGRGIKPDEEIQVRAQGNIPALHTGVLIRGPDGKQMLSEINTRYERNDFDLMKRLQGFLVRLDPTVLARGQELGLSPDEVSDVFQKAVDEVHGLVDPSAVTLVNSKKQRLLAGLSEKISSLKRKSASQKAPLQKFTDILDAARTGKHTTAMICSSFGARSTAAAIDLANGRLPQGSLAVPFSQTEKLSQMTPGGLIRNLAGCISLVEVEPLITELVKEEDLKGAHDEFLRLCGGRTVGAPPLVAPPLAQTQPVDQLPFTASAPARPAGLLPSKWVDAADHELAAEKMAKKNPAETAAGIREARAGIAHTVEEGEALISKLTARGEYDLPKEVQNRKATLSPVQGGQGGTYKLEHRRALVQRSTGQRKTAKSTFAVKVCGEEPLGLCNPKGHASTLTGNLLRMTVPSGTEVIRERCTSAIANLVGLGHCTPKVEIAIMDRGSGAFHDVLDGLDPSKNPGISPDTVGPRENKKLCSIQPWVKGSVDFEKHLRQLEDPRLNHFADPEVMQDRLFASIDQQSMEDVITLCCLTGETDGNLGNFLLVDHPKKAEGGPAYSFMKIDNSLTWPERPKEFKVCMQGHELLTSRPLTDETRRRIGLIDPKAVAACLELHGMSPKVIACAMERLQLMKGVVFVPGCTANELMESVQIGKNVRMVQPIDKDQQAEETQAAAFVQMNTFVNNSNI